MQPSQNAARLARCTDNQCTDGQYELQKKLGTARDERGKVAMHNQGRRLQQLPLNHVQNNPKTQAAWPLGSSQTGNPRDCKLRSMKKRKQAVAVHMSRCLQKRSTMHRLPGETPCPAHMSAWRPECHLQHILCVECCAAMVVQLLLRKQAVLLLKQGYRGTQVTPTPWGFLPWVMPVLHPNPALHTCSNSLDAHNSFNIITRCTHTPPHHSINHTAPPPHLHNMAGGLPSAKGREGRPPQTKVRGRPPTSPKAAAATVATPEQTTQSDKLRCGCNWGRGFPVNTDTLPR